MLTSLLFTKYSFWWHELNFSIESGIGLRDVSFVFTHKSLRGYIKKNDGRVWYEKSNV